jgi:hypothetical protein
MRIVDAVHSFPKAEDTADFLANELAILLILAWVVWGFSIDLYLDARVHLKIK